MSKKSHIIILIGSLAAGKTTVAKKISEHFNLPLLGRDDLKEVIFNHLGYSDLAWSQKVGALSFDLIFQGAAVLAKSGISLIIDSHFPCPNLSEPILKNIQQLTGCHFLQIQCQAASSVLVGRFEKRATSSERHPGHVDHVTLIQPTTDLLEGRVQPLAIESKYYEVDTNDFDKVDYQSLYKKVEDFLAED